MFGCTALAALVLLAWGSAPHPGSAACGESHAPHRSPACAPCAPTPWWDDERDTFVLIPAVQARLAPVPAQEAASLDVTVTDPTNAVIVGARIEMTREGTVPVRGQTGPRGTAILRDLDPGPWALHVSSPGFRVYVDPEVDLRHGRNTMRVRLEIAGFVDTVEVSRDPRETATDPRGDSMALTLDEEELAALPDDPDELAEVLADLAGDGAEVSVDGFLDGEVPSKDQIERVRVRRMMFSADTHGGGRSRIEIVTRPGTDAWRSSVRFAFRDEALNARNAFAPHEPAEQEKDFSASFSGPLARNRTSLSVDLFGRTAYRAQTIRAAAGTGLIEGSVRQPEERLNGRVRLQHALGAANSARIEYHHRRSEEDNLGVGDVDLPERAYSRTSIRRQVRLGVTSALANRLFNELRVQVGSSGDRSAVHSEAPTIRVLDAVTLGGANIRGGRRLRTLDVTENLSFQWGRHALVAGGRLQQSWHHSDAIRDLHGTFTFSSLEDYLTGHPSTYTLRRGDPSVDYSMYQAGWFVHDDVRLRKDLTVGFGIRHEWQAHVSDVWNFSPRAGFAWAPFAGGRTTVRGGAGIFYDWYDDSTYEETLQVDGTRVQELTIRRPDFPDPFSGGAAEILPRGRVQQAGDLRMPESRVAALAVDQRLGRVVRVNAEYELSSGRHLLRGRNVNAPGPDGERPDPGVGNVIEIRSIGRETRHEISTGISARLPWRRLFLALRHRWQHARNDGDGPLSLPADSSFPDEWGPAAGDIRHRMSAFGSLELPGSLQLGLTLRAASAPPYNITTGRDANGDSVFNDRPEGATRNAGRGEETARLDVRLSWRLGLARAAAQGSNHDPSGRSRSGRDGRPDHRVSAEIYLRAFNALNSVNRRGFRGVLASPFFGLPTSAEPGRRIELGTRVRF
jgi:hypothetical protein